MATKQLIHPKQGCMDHALVCNHIQLSGFTLVLYVVTVHTRALYSIYIDIPSLLGCINYCQAIACNALLYIYIYIYNNEVTELAIYNLIFF